MSSLDELESLLVSFDPNSVLKGKSYDRTWNKQLGFTDSADFHVGIPYNPWPQPPSAKPIRFESTLGLAFKDVLKRGLEGISATDDKIFIDITQLAGGWVNFFNQRDGRDGDANNLAHEIGAMIKALPSSVTPIIRFLIGGDGAEDAENRWYSLQNDFETIFWPHGKCVFDHPKAEIHVGFYSPAFEATLDPEGVQASADSFASLVDIVRQMVVNITSQIDILLPAEEKKAVEGLLKQFTKETVVQQLSTLILPSISWNHAKILAVNGETLMTGGGNYWNEYADNQSSICDMQCKVRGDAAISAHSYCDYFWQYLNRDHKTDTHSLRRSARANPDDVVAWDVTQVPLFERKPTAKTGKSILSVAKLGDWIGSMNKIEYPIQAIDAIRDLIHNMFWRIMWVRVPTFIRMYQQFVLDPVTDKKLLGNFTKAGVTPTAWASRITRCKAIANAKQCVQIDAEIIACFLQQGNREWQAKLAEMNAEAHLEGKDKWDGILWPYDLILALATFLQKVPDGQGNGAYILLTSPKSDSPQHDGWEDQVAANELKQRIRWMASRPWGESDADFDKWFDARCKFKRISANGEMYNHCKVYCVDKKLLYIGSDNPYPNYNEEHGIWIDDVETIGAWHAKYWAPRWDQSLDADMRPGAGNKPSTLT